MEASHTGEGIMRYSFVSNSTLAEFLWRYTRSGEFEDALKPVGRSAVTNRHGQAVYAG